MTPFYTTRPDSDFVQKVSAVSAAPTSAEATARSISATERLQKNETVNQVEPITSDFTTTTYLEYIQNLRIEAFQQKKPTSNKSLPVEFTGTQTPKNYKFNLPPHDWGLPLRPSQMDPEFVGSDKTYENESFHGYRRGRIWYWQTGGVVGTTTNTTSNAQGAKQTLLDRDYGFQFLWNPETITTNVARNMDITPSSADTLRVVAGVFPGQETVSFSIILDRTHDFAFSKATGTSTPAYYTTGFPLAKAQDFNAQIKTLMEQGTMADLEYLFRAINGAGTGDQQWTTLLGKKTANVGYLQPTLLGIALGPNTHTNLSYVGWISNIGITHTDFTESMIPIRTTVNISIECFSGSGISAGA